MISDEPDRAAIPAILSQSNGSLILSEPEESTDSDLASVLNLDQITVSAIDGPEEAVQACTDSWTSSPERRGVKSPDRGATQGLFR